MITLKEFTSEFLKLEDEMKLFQRKIDGIRFWELARTEIFLTLFENTTDSSDPMPPRLKPLTKLIFYLKSLFNLRKNPFFTRKKDVLISGGQRRVLSEDGKWWDIHTDPIIEPFGQSYMSLEYPVKLEHYAPPKTHVLAHFDVVITVGFLRRVLGLAKVRVTADDIKLLSQIQEEFRTRFNIDYDVKRVVFERLQERQSLYPLCIKLLKRIKPKLAIIVTHYARKSLVEACKALKIPVVELQHGVINAYHPGYSFPDSAFDQVIYPDYLLVFGNYWRDFARYPISKERVIPVGYPYLEMKLKQYTKTSRKKQIVFISQGPLGVPISKIALELSQNPDFDYRIIYKLHPLECVDWKFRYPWLVGANLDVIDTWDTALYKFLGESIAQVGLGSTAIYEGLAFGLKTFILDAPGAEYFEPLFETNIVHKVSSAGEIINHLKSDDSLKPVDTSDIFSIDATENTVKFLKELLDKSWSDQSS
jgi:hypothetical protein